MFLLGLEKEVNEQALLRNHEVIADVIKNMNSFFVKKEIEAEVELERIRIGSDGGPLCD